MTFKLLVLAGLLCLASTTTAIALQKPLVPHQANPSIPQAAQPSTILPLRKRKLTGKFLHITDIHPDPFYKTYSSTEEGNSCHHSKGPAGVYGAETSGCDSPYSLVNATFDWIEKNLKDDIDFIVWTGDSARHDNDEAFPRNAESVYGQNKNIVEKFYEVFGAKHTDNSLDDFIIPIVPTFGNNDILPHNILREGPNKWTKLYSRLWKGFIPEEQKHQFEIGGWHYTEVIPDKLAVFNLNTMYFFDRNAVADGCNSRSEPGYKQMEWLRIQLQFLRERGVKAIMSGHVPPARNADKEGWDETCWQKYALWMRQYRDVVIGSLWGHMNVDHFFLQDFNNIQFEVATGFAYSTDQTEGDEDDEEDSKDPDFRVSVNEKSYFAALRDIWSSLPDEPVPLPPSAGRNEQKKHARKAQRFLNTIGGEWAERFSVSYVSASVVPNYFPALRVFQYNITGLEDRSPGFQLSDKPVPSFDSSILDPEDVNMTEASAIADLLRHKKHRKNRKHKVKKPHFTVPLPPTKHSVPGPAYSPQPLSLVGYTQYYANLTYIHNDLLVPNRGFANTIDVNRADDTLNATRWNPGKHHHKHPHRRVPNPRPFTFEVEYDTRAHDDIYELGTTEGEGMTVRRMVRLATKIGDYRSRKRDSLSEVDADEEDEADEVEKDSPYNDIETSRNKHKKHKKHRRRHRRITNKKWYAFVDRAIVGTMDEDELHENFGDIS